MHLLNVQTRQLQEFIGNKIPPYAILSHTWGEDEVSFQDLEDPKHREKLGYAKIEGCCQQAMRDKLGFVWVDTCCIDKRSSAELSEAINSMFRWYGEAQVCYVYLIDVPSAEDPHEQHSAFSKSRWFTRGWTLQELIAPVRLRFFDVTWTIIFRISKQRRNMVRLGIPSTWSFESDGSSSIVGIEYWGESRINNVNMIERITGIESWDEYSINNVDTRLKDVPVATKLSWVSGRSTTRTEDMAYCLLGLLDVTMPLLYGEGHRAFVRLQEEFLKKSFDSSILLWGFGLSRPDIEEIGADLSPYCLAPTPRLFRAFRDFRLIRTALPRNPSSRLAWTVTPYGLHVELPVLRVDSRIGAYICVTNYSLSISKRAERLVIPVNRGRGSDVYRLSPHSAPFLIMIDPRWISWNKSKLKTIYLDVDAEYYKTKYGRIYNDLPDQYPEHGKDIFINVSSLLCNGFTLDTIYPPATALTSSWIYYNGETHFTLILHHERRVALSLDVTLPVYKQWDRGRPGGYKARMCLLPYDQRHSAIEVWDSSRRAWERIFHFPRQLNWKETTLVDIGPLAEFWQGKISFEHKIGRAPGWSTGGAVHLIQVKVERS